MGALMNDCDIYITGLLDLLNLRFAPTEAADGECCKGECCEDDWYGGIEEMVALQKEFRIFRKGTRFSHSVAALNLGGLMNIRAKNRWLKLLDWVEKEGGGDVIVDVIVANLESKGKAKPMYFTSHDWKKNTSVTVDKDSTPVFYLNKTPFIKISLPMIPKKKKQEAKKEAGTKKKKKK